MMHAALFLHPGLGDCFFICSVKEAEVKKERVEFERLKRSLQQQVKEIQSELETQRLELSTGQ